MLKIINRSHTNCLSFKDGNCKEELTKCKGKNVCCFLCEKEAQRVCRFQCTTTNYPHEGVNAETVVPLAIPEKKKKSAAKKLA